MTSQHTKQGPFESLASPLEKANVFYLALKIGYIYIYIYIYIDKHTHILKVELKTLYLNFV